MNKTLEQAILTAVTSEPELLKKLDLHSLIIKQVRGQVTSSFDRLTSRLTGKNSSLTVTANEIELVASQLTKVSSFLTNIAKELSNPTNSKCSEGQDDVNFYSGINPLIWFLKQHDFNEIVVEGFNGAYFIVGSSPDGKKIDSKFSGFLQQEFNRFLKKMEVEKSPLYGFFGEDFRGVGGSKVVKAADFTTPDDQYIFKLMISGDEKLTIKFPTARLKEVETIFSFYPDGFPSVKASDFKLGGSLLDWDDGEKVDEDDKLDEEEEWEDEYDY